MMIMNCLADIFVCSFNGPKYDSMAEEERPNKTQKKRRKKK